MELDELLTGQILSFLTRVPKAGLGICHFCHRSSPFRDLCESCRTTTSQVAHHLSLVVPISLYQTGGPLWDILRYYKDSPDSSVRRKHSNRLAAIISRFLRLHQSCIQVAGDSWDHITVVPPSKTRVEPQPLIRVLESIKRIEPLVVPLLETVTKVPHRVPSDTAFRVIEEIKGLKILLVDDTFTSGAGLQSAASALSAAGAAFVAGLVVGRVIDPEYSTYDLDLWNQMRKEPFDFEDCAEH